jgi:hypothetical protein
MFGEHDHAGRPSRRAALALLSGSLSALGLETTGARNKQKKRKRKTCKTKSPTCAKSCGSDCFYCFTRAAGPTLCGHGSTTNCAQSCTSDQDCLTNSPDKPYCAAQRVVRATGEVEDVGEDFGVTHACCIAIVPCA